MATKREEIAPESTPENTTGPLSAAEAIAAAKSVVKTPVTAAQEVDERGFIFLPDKRKLIGRAFTIIDVEDTYEVIGDYWSMIVRLVLGDRPLFIRDSSKGIREQIRTIGEDAIKMTHWARGLRVSDYTIEGRPSATFYLDDTAI